MNHIEARRSSGFSLHFVFALVCVLCALPAISTEVRQLSLKETVRQADAIVVGTITARASRWGDASHRWIVTDYTLAVEETVHAARPGAIGKTIKLTWWGGTIGDEKQAVSDLRYPATGERLVVMLRRGWESEPGFTPVVGFNQGLFVVQKHAVVDAHGQSLGRVINGQIVRGGRRNAATDDAKEIDLATFRTWLRANIAAIKAAPSEQQTPSFEMKRAQKLYAGKPAVSRNSVVAADTESAAPRGVTLSESMAGGGIPFMLPGAASTMVSGATPRGRVRADFTSNHTAYDPIVMNQFPSSFTPWSPEDQYAMSFWNVYGNNVFRVYVSPSGTYDWQDGIFDLAGWPSSQDLQAVYGVSWGANVIGVTFVRYDVSDRIIEADIALNPAFTFTLDDESIYDGGSDQGFRQVMTHELGHVHGLEHNFNFLSTMNYMPAEFRFFGFPYMDDALGIRSEYPASAGSITDLGVYLFHSDGTQSVADATYPSSVAPGGNIAINNYHVENVGTTTINTPTIDWYLADGRNFNGAYYLLGQSTYPALAPSEYFLPSSVGVNFTVPANVPAGYYYLAAYIAADPGGATHFVFPFGNDNAFSRNVITVGCPPAVPTGVVAAATTTTSVQINWNAAACASSYDVYRNSGSGFAFLGSSATTAYTDNTAVAGTAYLYAVKGIAGVAASPLSAPDLATTVIFTDPTLTGGTAIKAAHITQLRTAVDAVRTLAGLGAGTYTDPTITAFSTKVKAAHITDLRTALDAARGPLSLSAISYTDPTITALSTITRAAHINDLRTGVR